MEMLDRLIREMIVFDRGDAGRIQHFMKVHGFAKLIGECEGLDGETLFILETAAIVHDIGIRPAMEKYGRCNGSLQELEGPAPAEKMLSGLGFAPEVTKRVCYLVAHHHTYTDVDGLDYRILLEADFLVNLHEGGGKKEAVENALEQIFRTETGRWICENMFGLSS